jgi:nitrogenase-associated protein
MTTILFYEKPGCINNTRQKQLLQEAGYEVDARNLLTEGWSAERLAPFFSGLVVADWFNRSAPQVKDRQVIPERLTAEQAMDLMLEEPLLIRRPLMQIGEHYLVGFEADKVNQMLALAWAENEQGALERCPRYVGHSCSETEV